MEICMVDLKSQYTNIKSDIDAAIAEVLSSTQFIGGKKVKQFADNLAKYLGCSYCVPCGNGTDALQIALMALDLSPGDEVITTPFSFIATAEVILLLGLKPVFVDISEETFNIDPAQIEETITEKTKCIIPVHIFGQSCNMSEIMSIANFHNLYVIEDNAQALGADYYFSNTESQKCGTIGHIGCTSFFPSKNLGAYGDGGAILTNDPKLSQRIKLICNHGSQQKYYHEIVGVNSRLDGIQAAVLDVKLKKLDHYNSARRQAAIRYNSLLDKYSEIKIPLISNNQSHIFHQYTIRIKKNRDRVIDYFQRNKIPFSVYYPVPLHRQPAFLNTKFGKPHELKFAEKACQEVFSLPMHTELNIDQQKYIVDHLIKALNIT